MLAVMNSVYKLIDAVDDISKLQIVTNKPFTVFPKSISHAATLECMFANK